MESRSKAKKPREFEKVSGAIFRSYIHNFTGYRKLLAALHHLQKAETLYVTSQITAGFKLERIEDSDILEFVGYVFDALAYAEDVPGEGLICTIYFMDDYKKTKTYIFQYSAEFYKEWLSDKLPLIIGRNRNKGMARLRFISLRENTNKALEKKLDLKAIGYYIREVYNGRGVCVNSIVLDL